jgi:hypothetical protein
LGRLLVACASSAPQPEPSNGSGLTVTDGSNEKTYNVEEFKALEARSALRSRISRCLVMMNATQKPAGRQVLVNKKRCYEEKRPKERF